MIRGFHLTLMMGVGVARPVPRRIIESLVSAQVTSTAGRCGFQLVFTWSKGSPIDADLQSGFFDPLVRLILVVTVNGTAEVLIDGLITRQDMAPSDQPGMSTFTITGSDMSAAMELTNLTGLIPYPAMPAEAIVALILAKYAILGVIPLVVPSPLLFVPLPTDQIPKQLGTDLDYVRRLASRVGYTFYVEPGPKVGTSIAYWGPEIRYGEVQPALSIDLDAGTNLDALSFSFDGVSRTVYVLIVYVKETKVPIPIPIPDVGLLRPPLAAKEALPLKFEPIDPKEGTGKMNPVQAAAVGLARASQSGDVVTGSGSLDVARYGRVLQARKLVGVRGGGRSYDGVYYVKSVTHSIKRGEYKQSFTLAREGVLPLQSRVTP
ncbi:MAG TPA: hypothetical protein VMX54_05245 [Vicinamibacteria bacterium]|nr:hypothetical protein [Vicinamibacteria bacterium]